MAERGVQSDTHLEQMRELMVGPQMREYLARLEQVESSLTLAQESNQKRFDEVMDGLLGGTRSQGGGDCRVRGQFSLRF